MNIPQIMKALWTNHTNLQNYTIEDKFSQEKTLKIPTLVQWNLSIAMGQKSVPVTRGGCFKQVYSFATWSFNLTRINGGDQLLYTCIMAT